MQQSISYCIGIIKAQLFIIHKNHTINLNISVNLLHNTDAYN